MLTLNSSTPGLALEARLNRDYGPGNQYYDDFCRLVKQGFEEGWVASGDLDNGKYRRGRVCSYLMFTSHISIMELTRTDPSPFSRQPLHVYNGCLLRLPGDLCGTVPQTPVRRDQLRGPHRLNFSARRFARERELAECMDESGSWNTSLSEVERWEGHCILLLAVGSHFIRCEA